MKAFIDRRRIAVPEIFKNLDYRLCTVPVFRWSTEKKDFADTAEFVEGNIVIVEVRKYVFKDEVSFLKFVDMNKEHTFVFFVIPDTSLSVFEPHIDFDEMMMSIHEEEIPFQVPSTMVARLAIIDSEGKVRITPHSQA